MIIASHQLLPLQSLDLPNLTHDIILPEQNRFDRRQYRTYTSRKIDQRNVLEVGVVYEGPTRLIKTNAYHEKLLRLANTSFEFVNLLAYNESIANLRPSTIVLCL